MFKVAILTSTKSKIQKGAVKEHHEKLTKVNDFRLQLAKEKLQVSTLTDNWCKFESLNYFTIVFEDMLC